MSGEPENDRVSLTGIAFAVSSYLLWGFLPLLFVSLAPSSAVEIVSWRIVLSLVFCAILLSAARGWARLRAIIRDRSSLVTLAIAAVFILINWSVFIFATLNNRVVEASLGYFANPIVTVLLGVVVLRERLRPLQWVAIAISGLAVIALAVGYGSFPWISLTLAFSFGLYGLTKKRVGPRVDAVGGLTIETAVLSPAAIIALILIALGPGLTFGAVSGLHTVLMASVGVATATPLILFAAAARRIPLVYLGLVQYLSPILQLIVGVVLLHEDMPPTRWIGFAIVWFALGILTFDLLRNGSRSATDGRSTAGRAADNGPTAAGKVRS